MQLLLTIQLETVGKLLQTFCELMVSKCWQLRLWIMWKERTNRTSVREALKVHTDVTRASHVQ